MKDREFNSIFIVIADREGDKKAQKILNELENIDDECEEKNIDFVKTSDEGIDKEYDLSELPALAFYRHKFRTIYTGDLMKEDEILDWVLELYESNPDVIESVDRKTLQVLINDVEHLAVFFCEFLARPRLTIQFRWRFLISFRLIDDEKCASCPGILEELETIDDDTDEYGIQFVKSNDVKLAHEIGIFSFPALVYYETGVPIMYDGEYPFAMAFDSLKLCLTWIFPNCSVGNLKNEKRVLQWLIDQKSKNVPYRLILLTF